MSDESRQSRVRTERPSLDSTFLRMAAEFARRSTCRRRAVGCILVDYRNHIVGSGHNGVPRSFPHCLDSPCPGADAPSGTNLDGCLAVHAEANALLQCKDVESIMTCYTTSSPCLACIKLLLNTSCERIVFDRLYPHPEAKRLWVGVAGREWLHKPPRSYRQVFGHDFDEDADLKNDKGQRLIEYKPDAPRVPIIFADCKRCGAINLLSMGFIERPDWEYLEERSEQGFDTFEQRTRRIWLTPNSPMRCTRCQELFSPEWKWRDLNPEPKRRWAI
jgi:dCMP deaminase